MRSEEGGSAPKAGWTAKGANIAQVETSATTAPYAIVRPPYRRLVIEATGPSGPFAAFGQVAKAPVSGVLLFEQHYRGDVWRLEIANHNGRCRGNWRKWYCRDGRWLPGREGVTIPLERLPELNDALTDWLAKYDPSRGSL